MLVVEWRAMLEIFKKNLYMNGSMIKNMKNIANMKILKNVKNVNCLDFAVAVLQ